MSDALTAAIRRAVVGPESDAAVLLGGRGGHRAAAGTAGGTSAQVQTPAGNIIKCFFF